MMNTMTTTIDDSSSLKWGVDYSLPQDDARYSPPPWAEPVIARISELMHLPAAETRGFRRMNREDIVAALVFLERLMAPNTCVPWIGRLASGGLQLTWRRDDVEVEAIFDRMRDEQEVSVTVGSNEWSEAVGEADSLFMTVRPRLSAS